MDNESICCGRACAPLDAFITLVFFTRDSLYLPPGSAWGEEYPKSVAGTTSIFNYPDGSYMMMAVYEASVPADVCSILETLESSDLLGAVCVW